MFKKMGCLFSKLAFWRRPRHETLQEEQPKQYSWCVCNCCANMPTRRECKCCQLTNVVDGKIEEAEIDCITEHQGFIDNCLSQYVLESSYYEYIEDNGPVEEGELIHEDKRRAEINKEDFIIQDQKDATLGRLPGKVNGQQFIIQNCENCNIYIFDHCAAVSIDDCNDCNFFLGPIKTSVFIRDCKNCKVVVSCQQFRTRDCSKIDVFLCCNTQPIIEASSGMKFGCYQYSYPELTDHFKAAGVSVFNNNWGNIHDFTQDPSETHFTNLPEDAKVEDYVSIPLAEEFSKMNISLDVDKSVVPRTHGTRRKPSDESTLVVFFNDGNSSDRALSFISTMRAKHPECVLIQTKEVKLEPGDAVRVFNTDVYNSVVQQGPVIGMEFNGDDSVEKCKTEALDFMKGSVGLLFVSQSKSEAEKQIEDFYNFADLQMAI